MGLVFGAAVEQISLGLSMGAGVGLVVGATLTSIADIPARQRRGVVAAAGAILLAAVALAAVLLTR